ncbi:acyl carrier protein [Streptomyces lavendulae]|uniref:acyl carrier protein n=1 Tax=Streptomyces lavendulae TaxID=1914 RepID=UPI003821A07F
MAATKEEILSGLADILEEVADIPRDDVLLGKSFVVDLGVDSLSMVEIVLAAEEKFGVRVPDDQAGKLVKVEDAVSFIQRAQK